MHFAKLIRKITFNLENIDMSPWFILQFFRNDNQKISLLCMYQFFSFLFVTPKIKRMTENISNKQDLIFKVKDSFNSNSFGRTFGMKGYEYKPSCAGGTRSPRASLHRLQSPKQPLGGTKMADRILELSQDKFFVLSTPSMRKICYGKNGKNERKKM